MRKFAKQMATRILPILTKLYGSKTGKKRAELYRQAIIQTLTSMDELNEPIELAIWE
jgi:hypothetical protein